MTKKWIEMNDLSGGQYSANKNIRSKNSMLRSGLSNYNDAYNVGKRRKTFISTVVANEKNKNLTFENNAQFISCM